ncbi:hypothetical protein CHARACLAT_018148 [Characodon lateralis]|uniref:Secreted protein n=1 Tax=Characodon lateralis TaxID=208331 RepID=A0ABU7DTJ5_9TELE|nr:hypothetical protein [Characodon lateralis]
MSFHFTSFCLLFLYEPAQPEQPQPALMHPSLQLCRSETAVLSKQQHFTEHLEKTSHFRASFTHLEP